MKTIGEIIHNKTFPLKILDDHGNRLYGEYEGGFWAKHIFNKDGVKIYSENSYGFIFGNRL